MVHVVRSRKARRWSSRVWSVQLTLMIIQDALASYKRDRGEVSSKAQAPVGDSTWQDVRSKWLRKSGELQPTRLRTTMCETDYTS